MLYLIYGEDTYRSREKLKELVENLRGTREVFSYDASLGDIVGDLEQRLKSQGLFGDAACVVVRYAVTGREENVAYLGESIKEIAPSDSLVVLWDSVPTEKKVPARGKTARKKGSKNEARIALFTEYAKQVFEFPHLTNSALKKEILEIGKAKKVPLKDADAEALGAEFGGDLWAISQELDKFSLAGSFSYMHAVELQEKLFDFTDALAEGNKGEAYRLLEGVKRAGFDDIYILATLASAVRTMLKVKSVLPSNPDYRKYEEFGLHPYVLKKTLSQVRRFRLDDLKRLYGAIVRTDVTAKTGGLESETLLAGLISEF